MLGRSEEVEYDIGVVVVADHAASGAGERVRRSDSSDRRCECRRLGAALGLGECGVPVYLRTEWLGHGMFGDVRRGGVDDPQRVALGSVAGVAPRRDAVATEDASDLVHVFVAELR